VAQDYWHAGPASYPILVAEVVWTDRALANVGAIATYIAEFNPIAAQRMAVRLIAAGDALQTSPDRGRTIARGRRELTIVPPYLIRYRVAGDRVTILEHDGFCRNRQKAESCSQTKSGEPADRVLMVPSKRGRL
jgi:toxin ParE1/3/4